MFNWVATFPPTLLVDLHDFTTLFISFKSFSNLWAITSLKSSSSATPALSLVVAFKIIALSTLLSEYWILSPPSSFVYFTQSLGILTYPWSADPTRFVSAKLLSWSDISSFTLLLDFVVSFATFVELDGADDLLDSFFGLVQAKRLTTDKNVTDASKNLFFIFLSSMIDYIH